MARKTEMLAPTLSARIEVRKVIGSAVLECDDVFYMKTVERNHLLTQSAILAAVLRARADGAPRLSVHQGAECCLSCLRALA
jgi:hypothetical protein